MELKQSDSVWFRLNQGQKDRPTALDVKRINAGSFTQDRPDLKSCTLTENVLHDEDTFVGEESTNTDFSIEFENNGTVVQGGKDLFKPTDKNDPNFNPFKLKGRVCLLKETFGYLKPIQRLPSGYNQSKDIRFKPRACSRSGLDLKHGDEIEFDLGLNYQAPFATHMKLVKCRVRTRDEIREYFASFIIPLLKKLTGERTKEGHASTVDKLLNFLACPAVWTAIGEITYTKEDHDLISVLMEVVLVLDEYVKSLQQSFNNALQHLCSTPLFNPWAGTLKAFIASAVKTNALEDVKCIHRFVLVLLKRIPEKSRIIVAVTKPMLAHLEENNPAHFMFDALVQVAKLSKKDDAVDMTWDELPFVPSVQELTGPQEASFLSLAPAKVKGAYNSVEEYIDTYFRLLRADCFSSLIKGVKSLLYDTLDLRDMAVYDNVRLAGLFTARGENGFSLALEVQPKRSIRDWETSSDLMFGNLLCISPSGSFRDPVWATVSNRDTKLLKEKSTVIVDLCPEANKLKDADTISLLANNPGRMTMVESPTYYRSYHPVFKALQNINQQDIPFTKEIVHCAVVDRAPRYIESGIGLDKIRQKALGGTRLDSYQQKALEHALSRRVACIQGPPGTGKTFIGIKIVKTILSMKSAPAAPIVVLTYKNHALDEFLKDLIQIYPDEVARVGGRSQNENLDQYNLAHLKINEDKSKVLRKKLAEQYKEVEYSEHMLHKALGNLSKAKGLDVSLLQSYMRPIQVKYMFIGYLRGMGEKEIEAMCEGIYAETREENKGWKEFCVTKLQEAFNKWCPNTQEATKVESKLMMRPTQNLAIYSSTGLKKENLDEDLVDEEDIKRKQDGRLADLQKPMDIKTMFHFHDRSKYRNAAFYLFSTAQHVTDQIPVQQLVNCDNVWQLQTEDRIKLI